MSDKLYSPEEAASILGISRATITRCKKMGAPVRYVGTCGRMYRIDIDSFSAWMHSQGEKDPRSRIRKLSVVEMREQRHKMVGL